MALFWAGVLNLVVGVLNIVIGFFALNSGNTSGMIFNMLCAVCSFLIIIAIWICATLMEIKKEITKREAAEPYEKIQIF